MPSLEELSRTVRATLDAAGIDAEETFVKAPRETIVPPTEAAVSTGGERALAALGELGASTLDRKLSLGATLGEGGMGIVRLATQRSLGREVAVKGLRDESGGDRAVLSLLREAWVTGKLEHPNVVPVYDITLHEDGTPLVILKRIEGVDWGSLMGDAAEVRARFGAEDLLEWNLRVLMQVCQAVRFAHTRGVLHRDLKPENVMIGAFGEVYLVDWGIAVSLEDDGSGRLPLASEASAMAGTPSYMAPEMLGGAPDRLGPHTDVYLLGAILYEIVTGEVPHQGEAFMAIVASIAESSPRLGPDVPAPLAEIIRRAMDRDPHGRFENAEQVRLALAGYLTSRDADRLSKRAEDKLAALRRALEGEEEIDRERIYPLFGECRFGFRQALELRPGDERAQRGLDQALGAMVVFELEQGEAETARALLSEMREAPEVLSAQVDDVRAAKAKEDAALRELARDLDPTRGRRTRAVAALILGVVWTVAPLAAQVYFDATGASPTPRSEVSTSAILLALVIAVGLWGRESLMGTAINRRIGFAALLAVGLELVARVYALYVARPFGEGVQQSFMVWAGIMAMTAAAVDWRLLAAASGYLVASLILPILGYEHAFYMMSAANFALTINGAVLWLRPKEDLETARSRMQARRARRRAQLNRLLGSAPDEGGD